MHESTLTVIPIATPPQPPTDDLSLVRAAAFGAVVPSFLATVALMLVRVENLSWYPSLFSFVFTILWLGLYLSFFCAPFGVPFALLCAMFARTWLRQGSTLADVQARLGSVGAACGLAALWGVTILMGRLFDGKWTILFLPQWPLSFWGAALVVGGVCGWLLPWAARSQRPVIAQPA